MPLTKSEISTIRNIAKRYGLKRVWLFGSAMTCDEYNDIDLGAEGLKKADYFKFSGEINDRFNKMVDITDMDGKNPLRHIIRDRGKIIYDERVGQEVSKRASESHKKNAIAGKKN